MMTMKADEARKRSKKAATEEAKAEREDLARAHWKGIDHDIEAIRNGRIPYDCRDDIEKAVEVGEFETTYYGPHVLDKRLLKKTLAKLKEDLEADGFCVDKCKVHDHYSGHGYGATVEISWPPQDEEDAS